jgi:hypothetical protein
MRPKFKQPDGIPNYLAGPRFNGEGAAAFFYEAEFYNPAYSFRGSARLAGSLRVHQHPQIYWTQRVPVAGIGGLVAGQIFGQPLVQMEPVG